MKSQHAVGIGQNEPKKCAHGRVKKRGDGPVTFFIHGVGDRVRNRALLERRRTRASPPLVKASSDIDEPKRRQTRGKPHVLVASKPRRTEKTKSTRGGERA